MIAALRLLVAVVAVVPIDGTIVPDEPTLVDCRRTCRIDTGPSTVFIRSELPVTI